MNEQAYIWSLSTPLTFTQGKFCYMLINTMKASFIKHRFSYLLPLYSQSDLSALPTLHRGPLGPHHQLSLEEGMGGASAGKNLSGQWAVGMG